MMQVWILDYLLNSLWQAPLLYVAAALAGKIVAPLGSRTAHRLWVVTVGLQVILPGCSLQGVSMASSLFHWIRSAQAVGGTVTYSQGPVAAVAGSVGLSGAIAGSLLAVYLGVTGYLSARFLWRLYRTQQLAGRARPMPHQGLTLALADGISGPVTVGIRRSLLLLPPGFMQAVTSAEMQAVLAHESAHMRRHDYFKNLIYQACSLPVAYHPAAWLTRTRVTETREMVCDELAAASLAASDQPYARALLRLATVLFHPAPAANLHAIGILDANIFERRIMNLTQPHPSVRRARRIASLAACGVVALATTASAVALRVNLATPPPAVHQQDATPKVSAAIMASQSVNRKVPVYPAEAKSDPLDGPVVLYAVIGKDGLIKSLKVLQSLRDDYDASALEAVKDWTYKPYLLNGEPTEVETTITVNYSTDHSGK